MQGIIMWTPGVTLDDLEKKVILAAFKHYRENKTATAGALGISIRTLDNKFERYEHERAEQEKGDERNKKKNENILAYMRGNPPPHPNLEEEIASEAIASRSPPVKKRGVKE